MAKKIILILIALFVIAQFIPKAFFPISNPGVDESKTLQANTKVLKPEIRQILQRSCYDCHSNQTVWPWYSRVAPISWLLSHDVAEGRRELNFSEWGRYPQKRADRKLNEICEQVERGEMPVWYYKPMHPASKLSAEDRNAICVWTREERAALAGTTTK